MARQFYSDNSVENPLPIVQTPAPTATKEYYLDGKVISSNPTLEKYTKETRTWLTDKTSAYVAKFNSYKAKTAADIARLDSQYHQLIVEPLLPQSLYVITATLTGSVLARRSVFPVRMLSPVVFGVAAFALFLPQSARNVSRRIGESEAGRFPDLKKQQDELVAKSREQAASLRKTVASVEPKTTELVTSVRVAVEKWVNGS